MAGRTIDQGVSLLTTGEIRVAVLPVGPVPRDVLDEYLELINRYHHVSLSATRSFYRESAVAQQASAAALAGMPGATRPPFQFMDWSNSYMHLRFLQSEDARRRTRLPDLYPGRQVLAILGVVYCPMCSSVQQAYDEFKKICRSYPEAFVTRCFVFEPSEDHIRQERECQQLADLVMFPPGGPSHLEQHLEVWMHDLAAALLTEFEKWMLTATPTHMKLSGYADSAEFTGASAVLDEMQKRLAAVDGEMREKQRRGRLLKCKGDMCLLSGSPRDAAEHYRMAQEISKACNDLVWYGVALEGIAAARVYEVISSAAGPGSAGGLEAVSAGDTGGSTGSSVGPAGAGGGGGKAGGKATSSRVREGARGGGGGGSGSGYMTAAKWELLRRSDAEALVRECFTDARAAYKKKGGVAPLMIEQHLKLARLVAGLRGAGARREVAELTAAVNDLLPYIPVLEDRLVATVECAQVLGMVGCCRKRKLLLWHAMEQARSFAAEKGDLLRIAVRALEPPEDPQAQDPDDLPRAHWSISRAINRSTSGAHSRGWEAVQTVVLEATLSAAKQAHAPAEVWEAAAALLREHYPILTPQYQAALMETLAQASAMLSNRQRTRPGLGPGPLVQLKRLLPAALPLQPAPLTLTAAGTIAAGGGAGRGKGAGAGLFIFNPYAAKRQAKQEAWEASTPDWACSDEGRVEVYLVNPLAVPLKIDQLQLHVKYVGQQPGATATGAGGGGGAAATVSTGAPGLTRGSSGRQPAAGSSSHVSGTATPLPHATSATAVATAAAAAAKAFRTPSLNLVLAPNGRPHRVVLCGKPQLPGTYSIDGCTVSSWGVTWHIPFTVPLKRLAAAAARAGGGGGGGGSTAHAGAASGAPKSSAAAAGGGRFVTVNVLPQLPLLKAIIRASPWGGALNQLQPATSASQPGTPAAGAAQPSSVFSGAGLHQQPLHTPHHQQQPIQPFHQQQQQQQQQVTGSQGSQQPNVSDPTVVAISPRDDDIHAASAHTAFSEDLQRSPPVAVFEGQRLAWSLTLQNLGALPVTALSISVTNHKGVALKPLRGAPLPASFQGVHLEADDTALQPPPAPATTSPTTAGSATAAPTAATSGPTSPTCTAASATGTAAVGTATVATAAPPSPSSSGSALPLRPNTLVTLPLALAVGQAPRGTFREMSVEVTICYLSKPADWPADDPGAPLFGRRMKITLTFEIQPSLSIASMCFLDHFAPLRNGHRLALDRPIDPRVSVSAALAGASSTGGGLEGAGTGGGGAAAVADYDSDSAAEGMVSRSGSVVTVEYGIGGHLPRPRHGSLTTFSRSSLGGPSLIQSLAAGGGAAPGLGVLSSRLAGLDLSLGGSRTLKAPVPISIQSSLTSPMSSLADRPLADRPASWVGAADDPRVGAPFGVLTPQGSAVSQADGAGGGQPPGPGADGAGGLAATAAASRSKFAGRSAVITPEGPDDALGLVTDSVLCVYVRNTSSYFFRAWLARLDEAAGSQLLTAAAAAAADCPIEVLQPGDTARLVCVLPSAALAAQAGQAADGAAASAPAGEGDGAGEASAHGGIAAASPTATKGPLAAAQAAMLASGTSLRHVRLTIQPPGGGAAAVLDHAEAPPSGAGAPSPPQGAGRSGGGGVGPAAASTTSAFAAAAAETPATGSGGGTAELVEEADRMAAAEGLAEGWAVVWEMVVGLSETAAGRAPPRGMVRLAAVDIARTMSATAVQALRPSTIHFQLVALSPAFPGAGAVPRLKDLTYRLRSLGLLPANVAGSIWGLRVHMGEVIRLELLVHNSGYHTHMLTFSVAATPSAAAAPGDFLHHPGHHQNYLANPALGFQAPYGYPLAVQHFPGAQLGHGHAASFQGGVGMPYGTVRHVSHGRYTHTTDGYTSGGSFVVAAARTSGGGGGGMAAGELYSSGGAAAVAGPGQEPGIDPGVVVVGAVQNVHVTVEAQSTLRHPLALTFAQPGLYQLYVYDVCALPHGVDVHLGAGRPGAVQGPQRIYASVDRLNVLCT